MTGRARWSGAGAPADPRRRTLLEAGSTSAGTTWSASWRAELRQQGRPASGGWPGTMNEARVRVAAALVSELAERRMGALSPEEREWAARTAYAAARRDWLLHGDRDELSS